MKILVIKPSSLGDIIHGLQVVAIIKKHIKNISVDWVVRDCFSGAVLASNLVDNLFIFERHGGFFKFCKLISQIRKFKYDIVIDMQGLARSGAMTAMAKADLKVGRKDSRELSRLAYDKKICLPKKKHCHSLDILLEFLPIFGLEAKFEYALDFCNDFPGGNIESASNCCETNFIFSKENRDFLREAILLFPESRRSEKQWPFFRELVEKLAKKHENKNFIIVGQREDENFFEAKNVFNLTGKTSLGDVLFLIKNCRMLIANDSAPIHIGAALQKTIIALFGPTDPEKFGPYPLECERHHVICCKNLNFLPVEKVMDVISSAIACGQKDRCDPESQENYTYSR